MKAMQAVLILALLLLCMYASAQPRVVSTSPGVGSRNIIGPEVIIEVRFSEPMVNEWSLVASGRGEAPELIGDPWFENPQTWRVRVKVAPGKTYGIGLNSPTRKGFRSAANGSPLEPFSLVFETAAEAAAPEPQSQQQTTPGLAAEVALDRFAAFPADVSFPPGWREGETRERIQTIERNLSIDVGQGAPVQHAEKQVTTSALQVLAVQDARISHALGQLVKAEAYETNPQTGQLEGVPQQTPDTVVDVRAAQDRWQARTHGDPVPRDAVAHYLLVTAVDNAFAPRGKVQEGDQWQLQGQLMQVAGDLLGADGPVTGTVTCRFASRGQVAGHPSAQIAHTWNVSFLAGGISLQATGQGTTTYLADARKFVSNSVQLDLTIPRQELQDGTVVQGTGTQTSTERLRYFPKGEYPELRAGAAAPTVMQPAVSQPVAPQQVPQQATDADTQSLQGTWVWDGMGYQFQLTFSADGTYTSRQTYGGKTTDSKGNWILAANQLELKPAGLQSSRKYGARALGQRALELTDPVGRVIVFAKQ